MPPIIAWPSKFSVPLLWESPSLTLERVSSLREECLVITNQIGFQNVFHLRYVPTTDRPSRLHVDVRNSRSCFHWRRVLRKMVGFNDMTQVAYLVGKYVNLMMPELILGCSTNSKRFCQFEKQKVRCGREQFVVAGL